MLQTLWIGRNLDGKTVLITGGKRLGAKLARQLAEKGASLEAVRLMRANLPDSIRIKASGGIRTYAFAKELIEAGASRIGCSASVSIVMGTHVSEKTSY